MEWKCLSASLNKRTTTPSQSPCKRCKIATGSVRSPCEPSKIAIGSVRSPCEPSKSAIGAVRSLYEPSKIAIGAVRSLYEPSDFAIGAVRSPCEPSKNKVRVILIYIDKLMFVYKIVKYTNDKYTYLSSVVRAYKLCRQNGTWRYVRLCLPKWYTCMLFVSLRTMHMSSMRTTTCASCQPPVAIPGELNDLATLVLYSHLGTIKASHVVVLNEGM